MKRRLLGALLSWLSLLSFGARAQTNVTIAQENFETDGEGVRYVSDAMGSGSTTIYFERRVFTTPTASTTSYSGSSGPVSNQLGSYAWTGERVRGNSSAGTNANAPNIRPTGYVQLTVPATNYKNLRLVVAFADPHCSTCTGNNVSPPDRIRLRYSFDGGPFVTAGLLVNSNGSAASGAWGIDTSAPLDSVSDSVLGQAYRDVTAPISGTGSSLRVQVVVDANAPEITFDNIRVIGDVDATAKPTLATLETSTLTYTEGQVSPVQVTNTLTVGYSDNSATNITGGTVSVSSGFTSGDLLNYSTQGTISGAYSNGVLTLTGTASQAAYQAALRTITYSNSNTSTLPNGTRQITFQLSNGSAQSNTPVRNLNVVAVLNAAATLPYTENFNSDGEGTRYFGNSYVRQSTTTGFFRATTSPAYSGTDQIGSITFTGWSGGYWFGEGTKLINPTGGLAVQLAPVNAAGATGLKFVVAVGSSSTSGSAPAWDAADYFKLYYRTSNSGSWTEFGSFTTTADGVLHRGGNADSVAVGTALHYFTFPLPAAAAVSTLDFQLVQASDGDEELAFDNIRISGAVLPTVTTTTPSTITSASATLGGTITSNGDGTLTERGVVYVLGTGTPTTSNTKALVSTSGVTTGAYSGTVSGLSPGTTYTVRAYAINEAGTGYGSNVTFTTSTTVSSITTTATSPTNATSISYTVTFGASVSGVTTSNFTLSPNTTGATITSVSAGPSATYTVVVNTGTSNGQFTLNLANATGISPGISTTLPYAGPAVTIDKTAPIVSSVGVPANGTYRAGQVLSFTVNFSEAVTVTGTPQLGLTIGSTSQQASYVSGSGGTALVFSYTVQSGDLDANGIALASALALNGGTIQDVATNNATLTLNGVPATTGILVDGIAPTVSSSNRQTPTATTTNATTLVFRVTFSEAVNGVSTGAFSLATSGTNGTIAAISMISSSVYDVTVNSVSGNGTLGVNVKASGTGITDAAGNGLSGGATGQTYTIDQTAPTVTALTSTAGTNGTSTTTTPFAFSVTFSEAVAGFAASGITVSNGSVTSAPAGTSPGTTFTFTVTPTTAGTATTVTIAANAAQDAAGNQSVASSAYSLTYQPTATVTGISKLAPTTAQSADGTATAQVSFTVTFSAPVSGVSASNFSLNPTTSGAGIASVSPATGPSASYTVVVNTGTSDGTLQLNVANATGISPSVTNTPFSGSSAAYTISKSFAAQPQLVLQGGGSASNKSDVTAFVDGVNVVQNGTSTVAANALQNGSFETNNLGSNDYLYPSTGLVAAPWTFTSQAGIARIGGSGFTPPASGQGSFVGFVQTSSSSSGSITQNLAVPTGSYQVKFVAAQRSNQSQGAEDQLVNVFLNNGIGNVFLGSIRPTATGSPYDAFTSASFSVTAPAVTATVSTTSGSPTSTSPIPFRVDFSQSVGTTFTASDVTVTGGGTPAGFSGSGAGPYTFTVTPSGAGTVTVSVAAGMANDANNTQNSASNAVSVQYQLPVTAAPVVVAPTNGSLTNTTTPTYSGTAPAGSTVTVYVDGTAIGTTTATAAAAGNNWTLTQPTALAQGVHTVYATAQTSGSSVSANSTTNTFTVDTVQPTVTSLTSTAGTSGSSSTTSPFAFTVTFSEAVSGLSTGGISVTNGTVTTAPSGTSPGTSFTFTVTPTTAGTATTVTIATNAAQDAAGNGSVASAAYTLTYTNATTWTGTISPDWFTAGNWTNGVPTAALSATIPNGTVFSPFISAGTATTLNLTLNSGATLSMSGGTLDVRGNLTDNGTFLPTGGTAILGGGAPNPSLLGSAQVRFWNLTVGSNNAQLNTSAGASVRRLLTLTGTFTTNGNTFTLESDATGTALVVNSGGVVTGNATVQRYIDASGNTGTTGYRHYSSPVQAATVGSLNTAGFTAQTNTLYNTADPNLLTLATYPNVFSYDESKIAGSPAVSFSDFDKGYQSPASTNTTLTPGRGYAVQIGNTEKVQFTGQLNNGTGTINGLTYAAANTAGAASAGWALIGNPYPAPLDWGTVGNATSGVGSSLNGVDAAAYVFQSLSAYSGQYKSFNNGVGAGTGLIASGQGFFVHTSTPGTTGSVTLNNNNRVTTYANPAFQRTGETRPLVRLSLGLGSLPATVATAQDETFVYFEAGATDAFDGRFDAYKLNNPSGYYLGSVTPGTSPVGLSIDARSPLAVATTTEIPLWVSLPAGTYTLTATELLNFAGLAGGTTVQLRDALLGTLTDLSTTPSHSFTVAANAPYAGRFSLVFRTSSALATASGQTALVSLYPNPMSHAQAAVTLAVTGLPAGTGQLEATVLNALGQVVGHTSLPAPASGTTRVSLSTQGLATGVYLVRLTGAGLPGGLTCRLTVD
ncbi:MAG: Ig-like domain-containing protein [Janthinobacterium lividum]